MQHHIAWHDMCLYVFANFPISENGCLMCLSGYQYASAHHLCKAYFAYIFASEGQFCIVIFTEMPNRLMKLLTRLLVHVNSCLFYTLTRLLVLPLTAFSEGMILFGLLLLPASPFFVLPMHLTMCSSLLLMLIMVLHTKCIYTIQG